MNGLSYDGRVAPETTAPVAVADDADRMRAGRPIILRRNRPPQRRVYAQHRIVTTCDELSIDRRFRLSIHTHGQTQRVVSQQAGERPVVIPELLEIAVRETVALRPAASAAERDESLRLFDRQHF